MILEKLAGEVKNIIYRNEENGYTVLELVDASGDEITAVGAMPLANVGERIELEGMWTEHRAYGMQFRTEACKTLAPATLTALVNYLGSGLIKGVGESTAKNIVTMFGMETLEVLENEPDRLCNVPGIGRVKANLISSSYNEGRDMRDIMLALQEYGISITQATKLYKLYGPLCLGRIRENPYSLIDDVENIGFKTADKIAQNAGIQPDSPFRLKAGIKYTLQWARQEGHTYLPREKLISVSAQILQTELLKVEEQLDELILTSQLVYKLAEGTDAVFLPYLFMMEQECARRLSLLNIKPSDAPYLNLNASIHLLEQQLNTELDEMQRKAVLCALNSGALVITGGPGTGKTTILRFVIKLIEKLGLDYELCAPTGRAAKRMSEATGCEARTIHRMLEYGYQGEGFLKNEEDPITADVVIVDEMSMVDVPLMYALLKALCAGTRLIMVGDADQLPPVGAGNVLRDIIKSGRIPLIRLNEIYRQAGRSAIVTNAHLINHGRMPVLNPGEEDFGFEEIASAEAVLSRIIGLCSGKLKLMQCAEPLRDIQVLSPMRKGTLGVNNLNQRLQNALNPPAYKKHEQKYGNALFREGDKVMQTKNDYKLEWTKYKAGRELQRGNGVFNGDMGTIMKIDFEEHTVTVLFDDEREAVYEFTMLEELDLAYCISIHKSQGSEFPIVLLPLCGGPPMLMTRNLLYTAVTRARNKVYIVGNSQSVYSMVQNGESKKRYSALAELLCQYEG